MYKFVNVYGVQFNNEKFNDIGAFRFESFIMIGSKIRREYIQNFVEFPLTTWHNFYAAEPFFTDNPSGGLIYANYIGSLQILG